MRYYALAEHRARHSSDGDDEWYSRNVRLGGYKYVKAAIKAILSTSQNGRILGDDRKVQVLIQEGRVTFKAEECNG